MPEHLDFNLQHKYEPGLHIKIPETKLTHLLALRPYMTDHGQWWVDMVEEGQTNAVARPRTADDHTGDPEENTQDNIIADQYKEPQYQNPIEPLVVDGDEPQPENDEPPPTANPQRGTKRKKDSEKVAKLPKKKK